MENLNDLRGFVMVAQERSFTRAAARLGMSRSALSHAMLALEARLGVRLLTRTTRSVAPTEAGLRLLATAGPRLSEIDGELAALRALQDKPAGTVRISAHDHAIQTVLWPRLSQLLLEQPGITVELSVDYGLTNIVAQNFDAGVRVGDIIDKDMIAVRIGPDFRMGVFGAPAYLRAHAAPARPRDLTQHRCVNLRLPTHGGLYAWEFERTGRQIRVRVDGQAVFNNTFLMMRAAIDGLGLAYVPADLAEPHVATGQLRSVLQEWWPQLSGYHLYYPNRRPIAPALARVVQALRYQAPARSPRARPR
ncbi:LysR family transcriptional regulator [Pseudomonadota bacterium AL_CKDN230030165-1A_HGKHYDSX7]